MKNTTIIITGLLIAVLLTTSCDKRDDYFKGLNQVPQIIISKNGVPIDKDIVDSIKISTKRTYQYKIMDEEQLELDYETKGTDLELLVQNGTIQYIGQNAGKTELLLQTKDSFRAIGQRLIVVETMKNMLPIAKMDIKIIGTASPNEIEIDASASYDQDKRFGGKIVLYEYELHNYTFQSPLSKIRYIFGSGGQKKIGLKVQDNDGEWSEQIIQYFVID